MSVNAVSGTSLRHDLVSALRQARAAGIQPIDASGYSTASQDTGSTQGTGSGTTAPTSSTATSPALSSDLMASLLQLQSDFSQMGLQTGVTAGSDADNATSTSGATDVGEAATSSAPVHHHHGHHASAPEPNAAGQAGSSTTATDLSADAPAATGGSSTAGDTGDGLQSLLQHVTKAIAAYAMGGPVGIAAAALTSSKA